jgi:23S rRNA maturation mini-RNase III
MNKPDFNAMSKAELKAYVLEHRDDLDALEALFSRRSPNAKVIKFPFPNSEVEWKRQQTMLESLLGVEKNSDAEEG